ncbi:MAG: hypothetical protein RLZZ01_506, partial [Actinomycetota bacterium]
MSSRYPLEIGDAVDVTGREQVDELVVDVLRRSWISEIRRPDLHRIGPGEEHLDGVPSARH